MEVDHNQAMRDYLNPGKPKEEPSFDPSDPNREVFSRPTSLLDANLLAPLMGMFNNIGKSVKEKTYYLTSMQGLTQLRSKINFRKMDQFQVYEIRYNI